VNVYAIDIFFFVCTVFIALINFTHRVIGERRYNVYLVTLFHKSLTHIGNLEGLG
jgi:hypothetical protein